VGGRTLDAPAAGARSLGETGVAARGQSLAIPRRALAVERTAPLGASFTIVSLAEPLVPRDPRNPFSAGVHQRQQPSNPGVMGGWAV